LKPDNNQELTKLIGKRLREACKPDAFVAFPAERSSGLSKIRQAETRSAPRIVICTSSNDNAHTLDCASTGTEDVRPSNEPIDVNV
jgi:hypothetical protein